MNYRLQDFLKYIIPGLYAVAFIFVWYLFFYKGSLEIEKLKDFSGVILLLIPFVGFVVGYFLASFMSIVENLFYFCNGRRPSTNILRGCKLYPLVGREKILSKHHISGNKSISNDKAGKILQEAKQVINRELVEAFRINSAMSRNIFGAQVMLVFLYAFAPTHQCKIWWFLIILLVVFFIYWIHNNHVYAKYVLAEYGKTP